MATSQNTRRNRKRSAPAVVRYKRSLAAGIKSLAESTWIKFTTGIVLLTSGLDEAVETLFSDISALELGAHHGVMVLGFVNILSSLPDMLDGLVGTFVADDAEDDDDNDAGIDKLVDKTVHTHERIKYATLSNTILILENCTVFQTANALFLKYIN